MNRSAITGRLGGVTGVFLVSVFVSLSQHSVAAGEVDKYNMKIVGSKAHLAPFETGDYHAAVEHIENSRVTFSTVFSHANNLCVAYTMAQDFGAAKSACDRAVTLTRRQARLSYNAKAERGMLANALSNRGVLNALLQEKVAASADFKEAGKVGRSASPAMENLAKLYQGSVMVAATVTP